MAEVMPGGFGLYLHWPFCESKCPYCDFNSHVASKIDQKRWERAYLAEIARIGTETRERVLETIFFGGGTPSLMEPGVVARLIEAVRATWPMVNDPEITLEANPGSVDAAKFKDFRLAGVTRVSMGVQALNDRDLQRLGRLHNVDGALRAFHIARSCFDRVSFDLIYARQDQTMAEWQQELSTALALGVDHLSLYQLTIEPGTAFADRLRRGGLRGLPDEDLSADMYLATQDICGAAGLPAYEISNHARPGNEARHNLIYWRGGDYVGIGPGAHGRLMLGGNRTATEAPRAPGDWITRVEAGRPGELPRVALSSAERGQEYLLMSLRLSEGLDLARHARIAGAALPQDRIDEAVGLGLLEHAGSAIRATSEGRLILNSLVRLLDSGQRT